MTLQSYPFVRYFRPEFRELGPRRSLYRRAQLNTPNLPADTIQAETPFLGLAPFLRMSIAGEDLRPLGQKILEQAGQNATDAPQWMNLSVVVQCFGQRDLGVSIQSLALQQQRIFRRAASEQPAKLRLLMLCVPGDISANTPLDCLLEYSDVDLIFYYVSPGVPLALPI